MTRRIENGIDLRGALQLAGSAGTSGQVLTSAGSGATPTWSAAGGFTGGTLTSNLTLAAGTASLSPLTMQSGTNLTTATAGAMEYDGKVIYSTPAGRGVSPSMMFYRLNSGLAGSNVNTAQSVFGVGVTLAASTVYAFQTQYLFQKTAGTTTHTWGLGFGGTATINNIQYQGIKNYENLVPASDFVNGAVSIFAQSTANFSTGGSSNSANVTVQFVLTGTVSINAGGTFIPQYTLTAAPGGAYTTTAGSYFAIWPIGAAGSNTSVGPWA